MWDVSPVAEPSNDIGFRPSSPTTTMPSPSGWGSAALSEVALLLVLLDFFLSGFPAWRNVFFLLVFLLGFFFPSFCIPLAENVCWADLPQEFTRCPFFSGASTVVSPSCP